MVTNRITKKLIFAFNFGGISRNELSSEIDNKLQDYSESARMYFIAAKNATEKYWTQKDKKEFSKFVFNSYCK